LEPAGAQTGLTCQPDAQTINSSSNCHRNVVRLAERDECAEHRFVRMDATLNILLVEDVCSDAELVERELHRAKFNVTLRRVDTREDFLKELAAGLRTSFWPTTPCRSSARWKPSSSSRPSHRMSRSSS